MRKPALLLPFLFLGCAMGPNRPTDEVINAEIGDESFGRTYGRAPTELDSDDLRITTHLQFVEATLRAREVSHLPVAQQIARAEMLDRLNAYWRAGLFPRNPQGSPRVPRFVEPASADSDRRVCAVGAIAEPDLGRTAIDAIAAKHEHDDIASIHDPAFEKWAAASGLTLDELAMIQPSYHFERPPPLDSELTEDEIALRIGRTTGHVNRCFYDVLSARQEHPARVSVSFVIGADGVLRDVLASGTKHPTIKACIERTVSEKTRFRATLRGRRGAHSFAIIGPRTTTGEIDPRYLPVLFHRADADVNRCGSALTVPNASHLPVGVRIELEPKGTMHVVAVRASVEGTPIPRSLTTCITRAVESLEGPTFKGEAQPFEHAYRMELARPLAGF